MSDDPKPLSDDANSRSRILNRRDLLRASVVSGAALAFLNCATTEKVATTDDVCKLDWSNVDDAGIDEKPKCPDRREAGLSGPAEQIETALDFMWCEFAKVVYRMKAGADIDFTAIEYARELLRWHVAAYIGDSRNGSTYEKALQKFMKSGYAQLFKKGWEETAKGAASGGGTIDKMRLGDNWKLDKRAGAMPLNLDDEGAEQAGAHMWFHFTHEALKKGAAGFGLDVLKQGRLNSRFYVRFNVNTNCVKKNETGELELRMDYWQWDCLKECCALAGSYAATGAGTGEAIGDKHFDDAWCKASEVMMRLIRIKLRDNPNLKLMTSGCGG